MFKSLVLFTPNKAAQPNPFANYYMDFSVACPAGVLPVLQQLVSDTILLRLFERRVVRDLSLPELFELDQLLNRYYLEEQHNMLLDGRQLGLLKRFLDDQLSQLGNSRIAFSDQYSNHHLWIILGEFRYICRNPTYLVDTSFSKHQ